jgi:hypothetical protein
MAGWKEGDASPGMNSRASQSEPEPDLTDPKEGP